MGKSPSASRRVYKVHPKYETQPKMGGLVVYSFRERLDTLAFSSEVAGSRELLVHCSTTAPAEGTNMMIPPLRMLYIHTCTYNNNLH